MSNVGLIIEERAADLGNFLVGRLLPFRQKRAVGPFVFIDHMGPAHLKDYQNLDVGPHPHIGLSTLTYLFEGSIQHKDSLGNDLEITPGAVNWMNGGKGVVHSERTPEYLRQTEKMLHGLQIWIALPKHLEEMEPSFHHIEADKLPTWSENGVDFKLIAGKYKDLESPVPVHSPLYYIEIKAKEDAKINLGDGLFGESALYILDGKVIDGGNEYGEKQLLIAKDASLCEIEIKAGSTIYIFGGDAFPEERFIYWNFVSSSKDRLEQAKEDWKNHKFPTIPGDSDYVPLPDYTKK
ncbi:pirin family protein [Faecalibacter rhinopitheci]|uniref:Pirin family protein n=1 Tax=Faecalibacter rhinopitheci TaxID=2779678 RepID=A0A8J7KH45_9FLAO|nr:pirin family protein [Faecalibacter rhinopitheci]MBF0595896.1 pirin family protein [Faecalibacter rhinopitheci]